MTSSISTDLTNALSIKDFYIVYFHFEIISQRRMDATLALTQHTALAVAAGETALP